MMKRITFIGIALFLFSCAALVKTPPVEAPPAEAPPVEVAPVQAIPAPAAEVLPAAEVPQPTPAPVIAPVRANPLITGFNQLIPFADLAVGDIPDATTRTLAKAQAMLDGILAVAPEARNFQNTIVSIDDIYYELGKIEYPIYLMGSVHPNAGIRDEADSSIITFSRWETDFSLNEDLFKAVEAFSKMAEAETLQGEDFKLFDDIYKGFLREGFNLPKEKRDQIKIIRNELAQIGLEFDNNIAQYTDTLVVSAADMDGTPDWYKKNYQATDSTYKIDISYPARRVFMQLSNSEAARKALSEKFLNRAADANLKVIPVMVAKHQDLAHVLGYRSFAEYLLEDRMPQTPEAVWAFEKDLNEAINGKTRLENQELLDLKTRLTGTPATDINYWELHYYENILGEQKYNLNEETISEYFELNRVRDGLFAISQKVFGLTFKQLENPSVWHPDVTMYEVFDTATGIRLGYFYLDLFPRENKYSHAAHFGITKGKRTDEGYQYPIASLVCNFTKPTDDKPSLLNHKQEVETFFHEFGHLLHGMMTTASYFAHSGTSVDRDFVEAPSQIIENWVWDKESLQLFARHYLTGDVIPDSLVNRMIAAKNMSSGGDMAFQVFLGMTDLTLYDAWDPHGDESILDVSRRLHDEVLSWKETPNTARIASFGHLNGYAASYYGYAWSKVFAQDMFSVFQKEGILNPAVGMRYRATVLAPGGSREALDLVRDFLGREPNNEAFKRSLGL